MGVGGWWWSGWLGGTVVALALAALALPVAVAVALVALVALAVAVVVAVVVAPGRNNGCGFASGSIELSLEESRAQGLKGSKGRGDSPQSGEPCLV